MLQWFGAVDAAVVSVQECCPKLVPDLMAPAADIRYVCPMKCDQETRNEPRRNFALLEQLECSRV